jgi:chitin disaccharide deacetylase
MRCLIINADGYGFTPGITRAIEECIALGTVKSLSANVNFPDAERLKSLVERHPDLSVGCHLNPVVGKPVLPPRQVGSLLNENGDFFYKDFARRIRQGRIDLSELRAELFAQIDKTRDLAGAAFSHVDFHMGIHRSSTIYPLFLEAAKYSGTGRIRTHCYLFGGQSRFPRWRHCLHLAANPVRVPKYLWNLHLRRWAQREGFVMPDWWLVGWYGCKGYEESARVICLESFLILMSQVTEGFSEFGVHPGYVDEELKSYSTYLGERELELKVLLDNRLKDALDRSPLRIAGYRDIPLCRNHGARSRVHA